MRFRSHAPVARLFCNLLRQFNFSCLTCLGCVSENLVAHRLLNWQKRKKTATDFSGTTEQLVLLPANSFQKSVFQVFGSNSWELFLSGGQHAPSHVNRVTSDEAEEF